MDMLVSQAPGIGQGPFQKGHDVFCRKLLENKNLAAGQKGTIYFKGRVFRRRPDKDDASFFYKGRKASCWALLKR